MALIQYADVLQGIPIARIPDQPINKEQASEFLMLTVQDLEGGLKTARLENDKGSSRSFYISKDKIPALPITKEGMVIVSLMARTAKVITKEEENKIIPSNFAIILPGPMTDPWFVEWYLNEHPMTQRYIDSVKQGSAIRPLTISLIKKIPFNPPSVQEQQLLGQIYQFQKKKHHLQQEKIQIEKTLLTSTFLMGVEDEQFGNK